MVRKGNHPLVWPSFRLVNYWNLPRFSEIQRTHQAVSGHSYRMLHSSSHLISAATVKGFSFVSRSSRGISCAVSSRREWNVFAVIIMENPHRNGWWECPHDFGKPKKSKVISFDFQNWRGLWQFGLCILSLEFISIWFQWSKYMEVQFHEQVNDSSLSLRDTQQT